MRKRPILVTVCALSLLLAGITVDAKVSQEEAAKLGKELTPFGAIQAGNKEGTIPAWEGGIKTPPPDYKPGMHHPDPYPKDKVLFKITAENADQYADKLSPGQVALLKRYPETWYMNVYPSHRSAAFPERLYEAAMNNAVMAELTEGGNGVKNTSEAVPFPIPKEGVEAVWNHLLRYRGDAVQQEFIQVAPTAGGQYNIVTIDQKVLFPYVQEGATIDSINNRALYFLQTVVSPARLAGQLLLVHDTVDQVKEPRKAWTYNPGQRRVRRAPNVAYDNPGTASDGQRVSDQLDMFNGAPDRYEWTLKGRKEMYVPYNCYQLHSDDLKYKDILQAGHVNPQYLRYELHRVWVVEGNLRKGTSHVYARRTFYQDEDSWAILVADNYDKRGQIWRVAEAYPINYYENPLVWSTMEANYDLQNGRYIVVGLTNEGDPADFSVELSVDEFTPAAMRRKGRR
jgi:hypothetical protein